MSKSTTYDTDDQVVSSTISTNTVTVGYARKMGRENYGNEEASIFLQTDITEEDDMGTIEQKVRSAYTFAKAIVLSELGVGSAEDEGGVIRDVPQIAAPKPATTHPRTHATSAPVQKGAGGSADKGSLWEHWLNNPNDWWDNRENKRNPKAPDFKGKDGTAHAGEGLWIKSKDIPGFAVAALELGAEAA